MTTNPVPYPQESAADIAHSLVRVAVGSVPGIGNVASELLGFVAAAPVELRREKWAQSVGELLGQLSQAQRVDLHELRNNAQFIDCVLLATRSAIATGREEKLAALRAALANTAMGSGLGDVDELRFIRLVDEFSVWHLAVLRFLSDPKNAIAAQAPTHRLPVMASSVNQVARLVFAKAAISDDGLEQLVKDLAVAGLIDSFGLMTMLTPYGALESRITSAGRKFLLFIERPALS